MDFTDDQLADGRSLRTLIVIDDVNRKRLGIRVDVSLPAERVVRSGNRINEFHGQPSIIRVDNGLEYISGTLLAWVEKRNIIIAHIQSGKPQQHAYIERYNRTAKHEWLGCFMFDEITEMRDYATG